MTHNNLRLWRKILISGGEVQIIDSHTVGTLASILRHEKGIPHIAEEDKATVGKTIITRTGGNIKLDDLLIIGEGLSNSKEGSLGEGLETREEIIKTGAPITNWKLIIPNITPPSEMVRLKLVDPSEIYERIEAKGGVRLRRRQ